MKKLLPKLIASILALTVSASLVAMSSYAWYTMSASPEVNGIQVNIGGTDTILVAPDVMVTGEDGLVYHYPGAFSQTLDFEQTTYDYLDTLAGLTPVSTADGLNWVVPDYYDREDAMVQAGLAVDGQIKDPTEFLVDNRLQYANLENGNENGNYIYLDFWVVAPLDGYQLRVSTGDKTEDSGSYVITLMEPQASADGGYILGEADQTAAASVRIGFLANEDWASAQNVALYAQTPDYVDAYEYLIGCYQEHGQPLDWYSAAVNRFTVYEPNGNLHPGSESSSEDYVITTPLAVIDGEIKAVDIREQLTVQTASKWNTVVNTETGETDVLLNQVFQGAILDAQARSLTEDQLFDYFYKERLQMLLMPYLERGRFVQYTESIYGAAVDGVLAADSVVLNERLAGATNDVYITTLKKDIPQRVRMFIWLEGQDVDCVNSEASKFAVNIELAGGSGN